MTNLKILVCFCGGVALAGFAAGQASPPAGAAPGVPGQASPAPVTLTLRDALARAQMNAPPLLFALGDANSAHEDLLQAQAARRPSLGVRSDYLGTQGNGVLPSGRYVTNDGVHVYREWAVLHQDLTAAASRTGTQRAAANEAFARARVEIARDRKSVV